MASRVGLQSPGEAEIILESMISSSEICASIDRTSNSYSMVVFENNKNNNLTDSEEKTRKKLADDCEKTEELVRKIIALDRNIQTNPKFIKKILAEESEEKLVKIGKK